MKTYKENGCDCQSCYYQYFIDNYYPFCYQDYKIYKLKNGKIARITRNENKSFIIADNCKDYLYIGDIEE